MFVEGLFGTHKKTYKHNCMTAQSDSLKRHKRQILSKQKLLESSKRVAKPIREYLNTNKSAKSTKGPVKI